MMRQMVFCAFIVLATASGAAEKQTSAPARAEWNVRDHIKQEQVIVQSHRGAGELAPENTTAAFEMGWRLKTYPEADVRATTDGVIVAFHDKDFARVVRDCPPELRAVGVESVTWDQLRQLNVGDEKVAHRVPQIEEVFALMHGKPERHLYLDIKQVDLRALAALVKKHMVEKQVVLASPKHATLREWKTLVPESDTLLWMGGNEKELSEKLAAVRAKRFEGITQLQAHTRMKVPATGIGRDSIDPFNLSDQFIIALGDELRNQNILFQTLPYGGTTAGVYWKLIDLGLMSFATDRPDVTREAIRSYYQMESDGR